MPTVRKKPPGKMLMKEGKGGPASQQKSFREGEQMRPPAWEGKKYGIRVWQPPSNPTNKFYKTPEELNRAREKYKIKGIKTVKI